MSISVVHIVTGSVVHSNRDWSYESSWFITCIKLLFRIQHLLESLQVITPAVFRSFLCPRLDLYQGNQLLADSTASLIAHSFSERTCPLPWMSHQASVQPNHHINSKLLRRYWADWPSELCEVKVDVSWIRWEIYCISPQDSWVERTCTSE